jgi:hypothetical protein
MSRNHMNSDAFRQEEAAMERRLDAEAAQRRPCRDQTQQCGAWGECLRCQADQGEDRCPLRR